MYTSHTTFRSRILGFLKELILTIDVKSKNWSLYMWQNIKLIVFIFIMLFYFTKNLLAETIVLNSGQTVEGKIVENTDQFIKADIQGVFLTYYLDEVLSIDGKPTTYKSSTKAITSTESHLPTPEPIEKQVNIVPSKEALKPPSIVENKKVIDYVISDDEEKEYSEALGNYLQTGLEASKSSSTLNRQDYNNMVRKLDEFRNKYPTSPLSDDAYYLPLQINFMGCDIGKNKEHCEELLKTVEIFVLQHPDSRVHELTKKILKEIMGKEASGFLYIPYNLVLSFMKGGLALALHDFETATTYYSELKNKLDFNNEGKEELINLVYLPLSLLYSHDNKEEGLRKLLQQLSEICPECQKAKDIIQELINRFK